MRLEEDLENNFKSDTDPDGSWTGTTTTEEYDQPVQDADDL